MAKAKAKTRGVNLPVPQSDADAESLIRRIGELQRDIASEKTAHDKAVADLEEAFAARQKEVDDEIATTTEALSIWASAHRERLTNGGKSKTVQLATGTVLWRERTASVTHRGMKVDEVIVAIGERIAFHRKRLEAGVPNDAEQPLITDVIGTLKGFLRVKVTLNKEAMHDAKDVALQIPGVVFSRPGEDFAVEPLASQIGEAR